MSGAIGSLAKVGMGSASPVTQPLNALDETLALEENFLDATGLTGTRAHHVGRTRQNTRLVRGGFRIYPTPTEWSYLLPWIFNAPGGSGTQASPYTYALQEALTSEYVSVDRVAKVFTYNGVVVSKATIKGTQGQDLSLELELLGIDEAEAAAGTFPTLTLDVTAPPFIFSDLVLTANGSNYNLKEFELTIDNKLEDDRFLNSPTLTAIYAQDRECALSMTLPWGDANALYGLGPGGFAATLAFTMPLGSPNPALTFTMPSVVAPRKSPTVPGRQEIFWPLQCQVKSSGTTANNEVAATLVV